MSDISIKPRFLTKGCELSAPRGAADPSEKRVYVRPSIQFKPDALRDELAPYGYDGNNGTFFAKVGRDGQEDSWETIDLNDVGSVYRLERRSRQFESTVNPDDLRIAFGVRLTIGNTLWFQEPGKNLTGAECSLLRK